MKSLILTVYRDRNYKQSVKSIEKDFAHILKRVRTVFSTEYHIILRGYEKDINNYIDSLNLRHIELIDVSYGREKTSTIQNKIQRHNKAH